MTASTLDLARRAARIALGAALVPAVLTAQAVDRSKPPALPPAPPLRVPAVESTTLSNGLELVVVEMHKVPVVDVSLVTAAGSVRDPADLPGLATFTATMLQQGAGRRSTPLGALAERSCAPPVARRCR